MTSTLLVRRTFATLRSAELGFLGVVVYTRVHTPRRCGHASRARDLLLSSSAVRPLRTSCCIVGIREPFLKIFYRERKSKVHFSKNNDQILRNSDFPFNGYGKRCQNSV